MLVTHRYINKQFITKQICFRSFSVQTNGIQGNNTIPKWHIPSNSTRAKDLNEISSPIHSNDHMRRCMIERMLRVDHAGEYGAVRIYEGQLAVLGNSGDSSLLHHMRHQEEQHLSDIEKHMSIRRSRPTALLPLWHVAGYALGATTALLGREAAMACTVAVETAIGEHYNDQIRQLLSSGYKEDELIELIRKNRDEELDHLETGLQNDAEQAPFYSVMSSAIKTGCRAAIWVAERV